MFISDYKYIIPTLDKVDHKEIEGLDRDASASDFFINKLDEIILTQRTAVLYAGGFSISQMVSPDVATVNPRYIGSIDYHKSSMVLRESTAYSLHKWIGSMRNNQLVKYASINSNTCASSMSSMVEAKKLLDSNEVDEVIIIAEERTSFNTLRIFKEHRIPLVCGDALAVMRLTRAKGVHEVLEAKWGYEYNANPFYTTDTGYALVDTDIEVATVKMHGTGTQSNTEAEETLLVGDRVGKEFKSLTGHTQGASALLEICMLLDDPSIQGKALCTASGLGGFYGSCTILKH